MSRQLPLFCGSFGERRSRPVQRSGFTQFSITGRCQKQTCRGAIEQSLPQMLFEPVKPTGQA